jgi:uncharacterized heparinase superfamily protein
VLLDPAGTGTRLYGFHEQYGEDVLAAARGGEPEAARRTAHEWITAHPAGAGDAWHPYVLSTRVGNWIAAGSLEPGLFDETLSDSLWRQLTYLGRNVEDDVLGNHVIRNARALALGGAAFEDERLTARARRLLRRELPEQLLPDGGHYERSPVYHLVVLRDLLELRAACGFDELDESIERMRRFAAALTRPDGAPALFNDGTLDLAPQLELPEAPPGLTVFPETGYAVVRTDRIWLVFDCGPAAPDFLPAHAHADALSFQLWVDGQPVVIDPGTSTYEAGTERDQLRSSAAHATVAIDGQSQFEPWAAFRSGPLPRVAILDVRGGSIAAAVHWDGALVHHRRIEWGEDGIVVSDRVEGPGVHLVESRLPVAPGAAALVAGDFEIEQGCWSERLFQSRPLDVLVRRAAGALPLELEWRIELGSRSILGR